MLPIYIYLDEPEEVDELPGLIEAMREWSHNRENIVWVDRSDDASQRDDRDVGIELNPRRASHLKEPLNGLYAMARGFHCDFVVGKRTEDTFEDVCFFGEEEGRPDMFEVATYLGI